MDLREWMNVEDSFIWKNIPVLRFGWLGWNIFGNSNGKNKIPGEKRSSSSAQTSSHAPRHHLNCDTVLLAWLLMKFRGRTDLSCLAVADEVGWVRHSHCRKRILSSRQRERAGAPAKEAASLCFLEALTPVKCLLQMTLYGESRTYRSTCLESNVAWMVAVFSF